MRGARAYLVFASLIFLIQLDSSYAPFPKGHPYQFLNPLIEPWWGKVNKETQRSILSAWKSVEPAAFALAQLVEAKGKLVSALAGRASNSASKYVPHPYGTDEDRTNQISAIKSSSSREESSVAEGESVSAEPESSSPEREYSASENDNSSSEAEVLQEADSSVSAELSAEPEAEAEDSGNHKSVPSSFAY